MRRICSLILCVLMLAVFIPSKAQAEDDRIEVSAIKASSDIGSLLVCGGNIRTPAFTVTQGVGVRFPDSMGRWLKKEGDNWVSYSAGTYTPGVWKYSCQFRIDGDEGQNYKLAENPTVQIDGVYWTVSGKSVYGSDYSYNNAGSPEFTVEDSGELLFSIPSGLAIGNSYRNEPITVFSVAGYAFGGIKPYTFSKTSGPSWINVSADGTVSGTPTQTGNNSKLVVRVTDHENHYKEISISVAPTGLKDEDRIAISSVTVVSDINSVLLAGAPIKDPTFTDTNGGLVRFPESMAHWYKKEGENWVQHGSGSFTTGTWKYTCQFRIDGENGLTYMLAEQPALTVDGAEWTVMGNTVHGFGYSYNNATSPEFVVTTTPLSSASVSIQEPIAGMAPSYSPIIPSGANYTYDSNDTSATYQNGVMWRDETDAYDIPVGTIDFEAGHVYRVRIYLIPKYGFRFEEPVTGTVNGQTASVRTPTDDEENWARLEYTFPALTEDKPKITTQPKSVSVCAGETATFTVTATGAASYQWYYMKPDESTWRVVTQNGTSASYSLVTAARHNGYKYYCKVTNPFGSVSSRTVTLSLGSKPVITQQPADLTVKAGDTATFTVTATDATGYQWYYKKPGESTWRIVTTNGKTESYSVVAAARHDGYKYYCKVTNAFGSVDSGEATLTLLSKPVITGQPADLTVNVGATAAFTVTATGATGYQWYYMKPGESTWRIVTTNGKSATYSVVAATRHNGYQYYCKVSNAAGSTDSSVVTLTVAGKPVITGQPENVSVTAGATATFTVTATDATGYQWYYMKPDESTWRIVTTNGKSATYSVVTAARHNGYKYYCKVSNAAGSTDSSVVTLTVISKPVITGQPAAVTVNAGETATFTVTATGAKSYQWQYKKPGESTWNDVTKNGKSAVYSLTALTRHNGYVYRCLVTNDAGTTTSSTAKLTVQ